MFASVCTCVCHRREKTTTAFLPSFYWQLVLATRQLLLQTTHLYLTCASCAPYPLLMTAVESSHLIPIYALLPTSFHCKPFLSSLSSSLSSPTHSLLLASPEFYEEREDSVRAQDIDVCHTIICWSRLCSRASLPLSSHIRSESKCRCLCVRERLSRRASPNAPAAAALHQDLQLPSMAFVRRER